jgi:hypothetical protein
MFPLFDVPDTPYRDILKLDEDVEKWISTENELSFISKVYRELEKEHGKEHAQLFFLDGPGYKIAMEAWLPFIEGPAQFALYTAIMESNLRGSKCTVTDVTEDKATLVMGPMAHLEVLKRATFDPKLSYDEYRELYTSMLRDRAQHCSLAVAIDFRDTTCIFTVKTKH